MLTSRAHCMLVIVVKKRTKWRLVGKAGSLVVFQAALMNSKRDTHLSFYVFPKEKNLRRCWLHSLSRKNFKPTSGHQVCSLHFKGEKKTYVNIFSLAKSHPRRSPEPRRKLIVNESSTSNQETQPSPSLPASTATSKADESERDRQEIRQSREELGNVLGLKGSLEWDLSILKFGLKCFKESEKGYDLLHWPDLWSVCSITQFPNFP